MIDEIKEMSALMYDPMAVQDKVLNIIDKANNGKVNIPDPNNPFMHLVETNILPTVAAMTDISNSIKKMYPTLANTREDLYSHLTDDDLLDTYATPSKAMFTFYINKSQMITTGSISVRSVNLTIPKKTTITVKGIQFTMLNDVNLTLYNDNSVFVKIIGNNDVLATPNNIVIPSGVITDGNNVDWILFEIEVNQLKLINLTDAIIKSVKYSKEILITDQFNHINVTSNNDRFNISYNNFVHDINTPTLYLKRLEDRVNIEIPYMYVINNMLGESLIIDIYTTKGNIVEPISNYEVNDIIINFNLKGTQDPAVLGLNNISIFCKGNTYTYGGRNELDFRTLRDNIINRTTGNDILPITSYDIKETLSENGYTMTIKSDSVFNREYIVHKYLNNNPDNIQLDIFMDTVVLDNTNIDHHYMVKSDDYIIINPYTTFKYENNKLNMLSKLEIDQISLLGNVTTTDYLNRNQLFYTIYKYILDFKDGLSNRIYDVNAPSITNTFNNINNSSVDVSFTVTDKVIRRLGNVYTVEYTFIGNDTAMLDVTKLKAQLSYNHSDSTSKVHHVADVTVSNNNIYKTVISIDTTGYIDKNDKLHIQNNIGDVSSPLALLEISANIYLYTTDVSYINKKSYISESLYNIDAVCDLYTEDMTITFGKRLLYLYTKYNVDYTNRKYLKYINDIPLTYTENIYQTDVNGVVINYIDTTGNGVLDTAVPVITHLKDALVLDINNNPILKHRKGDIMLDEYGDAMIDTTYGMLHNVDLLLLEYEYRVTTNVVMKDYIINTYKYLTDINTIELNNLNGKLLENTIMKYKPITILNNVNLKVNNIIYNNLNFVRPIVTLYVRETITDVKTITLIKDIVSITIQAGLRVEKRISEIVDDIKNSTNIDIMSINITGIDTIGNIDIFNYHSNSSRFVIDKQLYIDETSNINVRLNVDVKILTI